jgi:hypothetical protein
MPNKTVTVNVDFSQSPPIWTFSGDVDPNNSQIVDIDSQSAETVTWNLTTSNLSGSTLKFTVSNPAPIVFAGGTENQWASGTQPTITRVSDTELQMTDVNTAAHGSVLVHYYQINTDLNGTIISKDPEVDEYSNTGR